MNEIPGVLTGVAQADLLPRIAGHERVSCRANSRRGQTDPANLSYQPVQAVRRALVLLRAVNRQRISTISSLYAETKIPKPTIVRMLETLMTEGFIARDNMCGGYRVTSQVGSLNSGYDGISRVIEVARPLAIDLTRRIKWPIGLGVLDGDAINIQFWTGSISPLAYTNTTLGLRPDLLTTAMGRAYLAYTNPADRDRRIAEFRQDEERCFGEPEERRLRLLLDRIRRDGYAVRDPRTPPFRITTLGVPIMEGGVVQALVSVSFFTSAVPRNQLHSQIVEPLLASRANIEHALQFIGTSGATVVEKNPEREAVEMSF